MARHTLLCLAFCAASGDVGEMPASEARRLSADDHRTFKGKLDPPADGQGRHHVFVHIPKAAGASFMKASVDWMTRADTLTGSRESGAFSRTTNGKLRRRPRSGRVVMLRHPVQLSVSQFAYCKHVLRKGRRFPGRGSSIPLAGLAQWANHRPADTYWNCYNPESDAAQDASSTRVEATPLPSFRIHLNANICNHGAFW